MAESKFYLAIDIGASSGRHILGWLENGKIRLEELYRFENKLVKENGHLCWDLEHLFQEVVAGLKKCRELERIPASIGIDTWGVDFVLLDKAGKVLGDTVAYRDSRTKGMDAELGKVIEEKDLYARNGIQKQLFNSIYQLLAIKQARMTIERFEQLTHQTGYTIVDRQLWFINPHYQQKFHLKPRRLWSLLARVPYVRNYFTTSAFYVISL